MAAILRIFPWLRATPFKVIGSSATVLDTTAALIAAYVVYAWWTRDRRLRADVLNLPRPPTKSEWISGHMKQLYSPQGWEFNIKTLPRTGGAVRLDGFLGEDVIYVTDPVALRSILVHQHTHNFDESPMIVAQTQLLWGDGIMAATGNAHKKQRKFLNPIFSMARMRDLTPIFYEIVHKLEGTLADQVKNGRTELDMSVWMSRLSLELIAQAGVGVSFDDLTPHSPPSEYMMAAKRLVALTWPLQGFMRALPYLVKIGSAEFRRFLCKISPHPNIRELEKIFWFLWDSDTDTFYQRKAILKQGGAAVEAMAGHGKDIVSVLIRANELVNEKDRLGDNQLIPQLGTLIFAGHDTTSNALTRALHLLAMNPERQERLRREVQAARREGGDLHYNDVLSLPYLEAVCKETLRMYAPVTQLHRTPRETTVVPLGQPVVGRNGKLMHEFLIPKDTLVVIGTTAVNQNPDIWGPTSHEWIPERWLEPLPEAVKDVPGVYSGLMTFLGGPRACLGFKFAEIEMRVALYILLTKFKFELSDKKILWNMYNFASPSVDGEGSTPSLPMIVSPAPEYDD